MYTVKWIENCLSDKPQKAVTNGESQLIKMFRVNVKCQNTNSKSNTINHFHRASKIIAKLLWQDQSQSWTSGCSESTVNRN